MGYSLFDQKLNLSGAAPIASTSEVAPNAATSAGALGVQGAVAGASTLANLFTSLSAQAEAEKKRKAEGFQNATSMQQAGMSAGIGQQQGAFQNLMSNIERYS